MIKNQNCFQTVLHRFQNSARKTGDSIVYNFLLNALCTSENISLKFLMEKFPSWQTCLKLTIETLEQGMKYVQN